MIKVESVATISNLADSFSGLWQSAERACEGLPLTRSLTHNLIVVTSASQADATDRLLKGLLDRHPCRAFVVVIHEGPCDLEAQLSGLIRTQGKVRALVLERLSLHSDWEHFRKLANLIRPLLVNDIHSSLFWANELPQDLAKIADLGSLVERTIVDSTLLTHDDRRSLELLSDSAPLDLAWLRTGPWRRTLAEAFEHFEWQPEQAETQIKLVHGKSFGSLAASRCLGGWLSARLNAQAQLVEEEGEGPGGEPWQLELIHGPSHVQIRHLQHEPRLIATVTLEDHCLLPAYTQATRGDRSRLLAAALGRSW